MAPDTARTGRRGILWMLATMFCFIALDAIMKHLMETYSLVQVTWARFFFATIVADRGLRAAPRRRIAVSRHPKQQLAALGAADVHDRHVQRRHPHHAAGHRHHHHVPQPHPGHHPVHSAAGRKGWPADAGLASFSASSVPSSWCGRGRRASGVYGHGVVFLLVAAFLNANYQILTRKVRGDDPLTSLLYTAAAGAVVTSAHRAVVLDVAVSPRLAAPDGERAGGRARPSVPHPGLPRRTRLRGGALLLFLADLGRAIRFRHMGRLARPVDVGWRSAYHRVRSLHLSPGAAAT